MSRSIQPATMSADRRVAIEEAAQQPFDLAAGGVDNGSGQLLLSVRKVVVERAGLDVRGLQDLVHTGGRIALPAEQQGRGVVSARHGFDRGGAPLDNTRTVAQEYLNDH